MKKILFCAGLLALITSCADDEYASLSHNENANTKGITFEVITPESPTTRGGLDIDEANNTYPYFWHAEVDKINIWSTRTNMGIGSSTPGKNNWSDWSSSWSGMAKYKATQSKVNGVFTGDNDANVLTFKYEVDGTETADGLKDKTASFIATYPATMEVAAVKTSVDVTDVEEITLTKLPVLTGQDLVSSINKIAMYSYTSAIKEKSYDAVGEKIGLRFIRPFTAAVFKTKGITEEYSRIFGQLQKISLEAKGYTDAINASNNIAPSFLDYGDQANYIVNLKDNEDSRFSVNGVEEGSGFDMTANDNAAKAKLELTVNKEWNDSERAFLAMSRINRSAFKTKNVKEALEVVYTFENITFTEGSDKGLETNANWPSPAQAGQANENLFVPIPALDMAKYPYLVTNIKNSNDRALIINSGAFSGAFSKGSGKVSWNGAEINLDEFNTIISKVELTNNELKTLATFTNLKHVTLALNEVIPANTFKGLTLETIDMPNVTTIADANAFNAAQLKEVYLPKYKFESTAINEKLLQSSVLEKLDMSGVETMKNVFPAEGFALTDFTNLTDVKVKDGVVLGSSAFKGCTSLTTIDGMVNIADGPSAFENSGIESITLTNTSIPAGAFKGCTALTEVLDVAGNNLQPTSVGNAAFSGSAIEIMDLSMVINDGIIGEEAFKNCTSFVGTKDTQRGINVLYVGATSISKSAFEGCTSLKYVQFTNATTIEDDILKGVTLNEVKFKQVLTSKVGSATMFGTTSATKLFLNPNQGLAWYEGNDFYPMGNKSVADAVKVSFQSIVLE